MHSKILSIDQTQQSSRVANLKMASLSEMPSGEVKHEIQVYSDVLGPLAFSRGRAHALLRS